MKIKFIRTLLLLILGLSFISCEKQVSTSPEEPPAPTGFIRINSNPPGATIYVNEKNTGRLTPDSLTWMQGGMYKLRLKLPFFKDSVLSVKISESKRDSLYVDFLANPQMYGSIYCSSVPSRALITLDHKSTNKYTPYTLTGLLPGQHTVSFQATGCREDSQAVNVYSSATSVIEMTLKDTTVWMDYNTSNSKLPSNYLTCLAVDNSDIKWIGTSDEGLVRFDDYEWKSYNKYNSQMPGNSVTCISISQRTPTSRDFWIGTSKGLVLFDGDSRMTVYTKENSLLPDNYITSIAIDWKSNVWVGTPKGLVYIPRTGTAWKVYNKSNSGLPEDWITQVGTDFTDQLWAGTSNSGLVFYNLSTVWKVYNKANSSLPGNQVSALSVSMTIGGIWVGFLPTFPPQGTDVGGLAVFDNNSWNTNITDMPSNNIESITLHNNTRWVCTKEGLVKCLTPASKEIFNTTNSRLPSNHIKYVAFDSKESVWIATATAGLVKYKVK